MCVHACVCVCVFLQRERENEDETSCVCVVLRQNFKHFGSSDESCLKLSRDVDLLTA